MGLEGFHPISSVQSESILTRRTQVTSYRSHAGPDTKPDIDLRAVSDYTASNNYSGKVPTALFTGDNPEFITVLAQPGAKTIRPRKPVSQGDTSLITLAGNHTITTAKSAPVSYNALSLSVGEASTATGYTRIELDNLKGRGTFGTSSSGSGPVAAGSNMFKTFGQGAWEGAKKSEVANFIQDIKTGVNTGNWAPITNKAAILGGLYLASKWKVTAPAVAIISLAATTYMIGKTGYHGVKAIQAASAGDQNELKRQAEGVGSGGTDTFASLLLGKTFTKGKGMVRKAGEKGYGERGVLKGEDVIDVRNAGMIKTYTSQAKYLVTHPIRFFTNAWFSARPAGPPVQEVRIRN